MRLQSDVKRRHPQTQLLLFSPCRFDWKAALLFPSAYKKMPGEEPADEDHRPEKDKQQTNRHGSPFWC